MLLHKVFSIHLKFAVAIGMQNSVTQTVSQQNEHIFSHSDIELDVTLCLRAATKSAY